MSYTYAQRTNPKEQSRQEPERAVETAPRLNVVTPGQAAAPAGGGSPDLEAVMQERVRSTFGDLSAVREAMSRTPEAPVRAPAPAAPYTGPVTHALSDASPSPSVAGPMQAKRRDTDAQNVKDMQQGGQNFNNVYATEDYAGYKDLSEDEWETKTHTPNWFSKKFLGKKDQTYKVRKSGKGNKLGLPQDESKIDSGKGNKLGLPQDESKIDSGKDNKLGLTLDESKIDREQDLTWDINNAYQGLPTRKGMKGVVKKLQKKYSNPKLYKASFNDDLSRPANPGEKEGPVKISGLVPGRMISELVTDRGRGFNMGEKEITEMMDGLMAPHKKNMTDEEKLEANKKFDVSMGKYKDILYGDMKHLENTYGTMLGQMHPEDVAPQMGSGTDFRNKFRFQQDSAQLLKDGGRYFDDTKDEDKHFKDLDKYYGGAFNYHYIYQNMIHNPQNRDEDGNLTYSDEEVAEFMESNTGAQDMKEVEDKIGGPRMSPEQYQEYVKDVQNRAKTTDYMKGRLFGDFAPKGQMAMLPEDGPLNTAMIDDTKKKEKEDLFD